MKPRWWTPPLTSSARSCRSRLGSIPESLLSKAEGIAIIPGLIKGGFIVGVRHGRGVIVTRDEAGNLEAADVCGNHRCQRRLANWDSGHRLDSVFCTKNSLQNLMRGNSQSALTLPPPLVRWDATPRPPPMSP